MQIESEKGTKTMLQYMASQLCYKPAKDVADRNGSNVGFTLSKSNQTGKKRQSCRLVKEIENVQTATRPRPDESREDSSSQPPQGVWRTHEEGINPGDKALTDEKPGGCFCVSFSKVDRWPNRGSLEGLQHGKFPPTVLFFQLPR